jgi:hypothetical protein
MPSALALLDDGLAALAAIDVDTLTDEELHELTVTTHRVRDRLTATAAAIVARWDARAVWANDQSKAAGARLARETGSSKRSADEVLRRARALATMPATTAAARAGTLSIDVVDQLVGANTTARRQLFVADEEFLIGQLATLRYAQATRAIRYWCHRADALLGIDDGSADDHADAAHLHVSPVLDDMVAIDGLLDPVGAAIFTGELDRILAALREQDRETGVERTLPQLRAVALVQMATRSAAMPANARLPAVVHRPPGRPFVGRAVRARERDRDHAEAPRAVHDGCDARDRAVLRADHDRVRVEATHVRRRAPPRDRGTRPPLPASGRL